MRTFPLFTAGLIYLLASWPTYAQQPVDLFRPDTLAPDVVFAQGFTPRNGQLLSLLDHALGESCDAVSAAQRSPWISSSLSAEVSANFAERQLREGRIAPGPDGRVGMWLYTLRSDRNSFNVEQILRQVVAAADQNRYGYTPSHGFLLRYILARTAITSEAEVVSRHIPAQNVRNAAFAVYNPNAAASERLTFAPGSLRVNPNFRPATSDDDRMDNRVDNLTVMVPPATIQMYSYHNQSCLLTCDAGLPRADRRRRSVGSSTSLNCSAEPALAQRLIGSDD